MHVYCLDHPEITEKDVARHFGTSDATLRKVWELHGLPNPRTRNGNASKNNPPCPGVPLYCAYCDLHPAYCDEFHCRDCGYKVWCECVLPRDQDWTLTWQEWKKKRHEREVRMGHSMHYKDSELG